MWIDPVESWLVRNGLGDPQRAVATDRSDPPAWTAPWLRPLDPNRRTVTYSPAFEAAPKRSTPLPARPDAKESTETRAQRARDLPPSSSSKEALNRLAQRDAAEQRRADAEKQRQARVQQQQAVVRQRQQETARRQQEALRQRQAAQEARAAAQARRVASIQAQQQRTIAGRIAAQQAASIAAMKKATAALGGMNPAKIPSTVQYSTVKGVPVYTPTGMKDQFPQGLTSTTQIVRGVGGETRAAWTNRDGWDSSNWKKWQGAVKEQKVIYGSPIYHGTMSETWGIGRSADDIKYVQKFMNRYGFIDPSRGVAWGKWTDRNTRDGMYSLMAMANASGMTIDEYMRAIEESAPPPGVIDGGGGGAPGGYTGPLTVKQRDKSVSLTNLANGKNALRAVIRDELGRDPTDAEIKQYVARLNAEERKNPTITEVTTTRNKSGSYESSSRLVKEGGVDQAEFALSIAKQGEMGKEREAFSAAKYFQVIADLTGGA